MFMYFNLFLVMENETEFFSYFVAKSVSRMVNLIYLKSLGKHSEFLQYFVPNRVRESNICIWFSSMINVIFCHHQNQIKMFSIYKKFWAIKRRILGIFSGNTCNIKNYVYLEGENESCEKGGDIRDNTKTLDCIHNYAYKNRNTPDKLNCQQWANWREDPQLE